VNQADADLLSQLRDIHGAVEPGWWPPAPGWWLAGVLVLILLAFLLRMAYRHWLVLRRRRRLLSALEDISREIDPERQPQEYLARLNRLFRVVALRAFPGTACARLQGDEWVRFITALLPDGAPGESLAALAEGPYAPAPTFDAAGLQTLARLWVQKYG